MGEGIVPPFNTGCERCGQDRPWTMVADPWGKARALCAECVEIVTAPWLVVPGA